MKTNEPGCRLCHGPVPPDRLICDECYLTRNRAEVNEALGVRPGGVTLVRCVGCGTPLGRDPPTAAMIEHAAHCPEHPLAKRVAAAEAEARRSREERDDLFRTFALVILAAGGEVRITLEATLAHTQVEVARWEDPVSRHIVYQARNGK